MERLPHTLFRLPSLACYMVLACLLIAPAGIMGFGVAEAVPSNGPPNILFIIMDDVGIDQMRAFGYGEDDQPRTPNIETIARAGVRFRNAWAMPECSPSRVSFFTGRYPQRTGVLNISVTRDLANSQASPFEVTTPRVLRTRGYKSGLFGKWHLTAVPSNDQDGNPNPGNPAGNGAPHNLGWDFFFGDLEGAPRALDTTAGGVKITDPINKTGPYSCGFVNDAVSGACYLSNGSCSVIGQPNDPPSAVPGRTCLEQGGILVPETVCQDTIPTEVDFSLFNGYYVSPLVINHEDGSVELVAGNQDDGTQKNPTDPRARQYLTTQQTTAAINWISQQSPETPWMATMSYSAAHLPAQQPPKALLPDPSVDGSRFNCATSILEQRILYTQMIEAMDQEIGRLFLELKLATRTSDGQLDYHPDATNTMVIIVGDNGSYLQTVRLPFDPTRGKGTPYQTGVWVPLIVAGPLVDQVNVDSEVRHMVNAAVDVYQLFGEVAGIDVRREVPLSHALDARSMLPYLTTPGQKSLRKSNFTQTGTNLKAPGDPIPPCVLPLGNSNVCTQIFTFQALCNTEGGTWYGPGNPDFPNGLVDCCAVQEQAGLPNLELLAHDAWAVRDNHFKLVRTQVENCQPNGANQLELQYEFYTIDEAAPVPKLDREQDNLLTAPTLPAQGLTPDQQAHFDVLLAELLALLRTEPACPGDGNLDKRVNQEDFLDWQTFTETCKNNPNQCSSVYDLNLDAVTDSADRLIIEANFGRRCGVRGFLR
jgi:arylsulfatase A-like enzyme